MRYAARSDKTRTNAASISIGWRIDCKIQRNIWHDKEKSCSTCSDAWTVACCKPAHAAEPGSPA